MTKRPRIEVILRGDDSGGEIAIMDNAISAGAAGPPLHRHGFDEAFYVLEGQLTFQLRDAVFTRGKGELAFAPRDVPHTFANRSEAEARVLIVCTPAGFERYFDWLAAREAGEDVPAEPPRNWPEVVRVGPRIGGV